jgi:glycosyltransferase involved in cell wall biosynthesis
MISVIIPTYKSPEALDLCLSSAIQGQTQDNQIIVVVDGHYDVNEEILKKYAKSIDILNLEENVGTPRATNLGVFNAKYELILIVNDDNVFPRMWDNILMNAYQPNSVISPNQIEPYPSMFSQFIIENLGTDPKIFNLKKFWEFETNISSELKQECGSTLPIFMSKIDYLKVGGWDESYPAGWVVDWEFFLKCQLSGMKMIRNYECHFYHFVSLSIKTEEQKSKARELEEQCHEYAKYKWGNYIKHNPNTNLKYL